MKNTSGLCSCVRLTSIILAACTLAVGSQDLVAAPAIVNIYAPNIEGPLGGKSEQITIDYNREINKATIDANDIEVVGISGDALGKTIPVSLNLIYDSPSTVPDRILALYGIGPLDASANGTYSVRLKEGQIRGLGENPTAIAAGEIATFIQNITQPIFQVVSVEALDITGEYYGGEQSASFSVIYSMVDSASLNDSDLQVIGTSGDALNHVYTVALGFFGNGESETETFAEYTISPIDPAKNGTYSIRLVAGEVSQLGNAENFLPAGEIATFTQHITDPISLTVEGRVFIDTGIEPSLEDDGWQTDPGIRLYTVLELFWEETWQIAGYNEIFGDGPDKIGLYKFPIYSLGAYRLRNYILEMPFYTQAPPWPEWIIQTLGDPNREGEPKDHALYFSVTEEMNNSTVIKNFSYVEEHDSPEAIADHPDNDSQFKVLQGGQNVQLDVLKNDTVNDLPAQAGDLTIIGLGSALGLTTQTVLNSGQGSTLTTDGTYIFYTPWSTFLGSEQFFYTIQDQEGKKDFAEFVVNVVLESQNRFDAVDDFASILDNQDRIQINVLANDTVQSPVTKSDLRIVSISPTTRGGMVSYQGMDVFYTRPPGTLEGNDTFSYTMTDNVSGTDSATVTISKTALPYSNQQNALFVLLMSFLSLSPEGSELSNLISRHLGELTYVVLDQGIQNQVEKRVDGSGMVPGLSRRTAGTTQTEAQYLATWNILESGFMALVAGQGDSVMVTQAMITQVRNLVAMIEEVASPALKADLQAYSQKTNNFEELIGKTFDEGAAILGVDPDTLALPTLSLQRINGMLKLTTWDAAGLVFKLWKSINLQPESWQEVGNVIVEQDGNTRSFTDPAPDGDRIFYQLTSELE